MPKCLVFFACMKNPPKLFLGERLRQLRLERGLTQTQLGQRVGLSKRMIFHYERHATRPPADKVLALANALGLHLHELIKDTTRPADTNVDPKFARKLERAKRLPSTDQMLLGTMIDSMLKNNKHPA